MLQCARLCRRIDLLHAPAAALDDLQRYCDPATFGVAQKDVLDTTFRKAGKLDRSHFALNFDVEHSGLLEVIRTGLFTGKEQGRPIRAELYKLNVYGTPSVTAQGTIVDSRADQGKAPSSNHTRTRLVRQACSPRLC